MTGAEQPYNNEKLVYSETFKKEIPASAGYDHEAFWPQLLEREVRTNHT